jgi:hypothetical protein
MGGFEMQTLRSRVLLAAVVLGLAGTAAAQFGRPGPGQRPPQFRGVLNPSVGAGAVYDMKSDTTSGEVEISLVSKEDVGGKSGYWIQIGMMSPEGQMYIKQLMVMDGKKATLSRLIMQPPQGAPMEMPATMFGAGNTSGDVRDQGKLIGKESLTTPAGTFDCEHYQATDKSWDVWIAPNVPPWGLVKSKDAAGEMTLKRTISGVPDRIKGTPQKLELPPGFSGIPGR